MKMWCVIILSIVYFVVAEQDVSEYRISMVSSDESPGSPAIFTHAESPVWDPSTQRLYFVDVLQQNVHWLDYNTGKIHTKHIGYGEVNVVSLVRGSERLLAAVRAGLYLLDLDVDGDAALRPLVAVDQGLPDNVINEGKPDALGRFWAGTKGPHIGNDVTPDKASFYSVAQESFTNPRLHLRPVSISNGITWALNDSLFYYIDSPTQKIEAFDFDLQKGEISGRRTILDIVEYGFEQAMPDGMTIDSEGNLWVAIMYGGTVLHVNPDERRVLRSYKMPASRVTSVCWGGPQLDELFVSTSRARASADELAQEPLAGAIFTVRNIGSRGTAPHAFRFDDADAY